MLTQNTRCEHIARITCTCFPYMDEHKCYTFAYSIRTNMIKAIVSHIFMRKYCHFSFNRQTKKNHFTNFILQCCTMCTRSTKNSLGSYYLNTLFLTLFVTMKLTKLFEELFGIGDSSKIIVGILFIDFTIEEFNVWITFICK